MSSAPFEDLPLLHAFQYLTPSDLILLSQVNSHWRFLADSDLLWTPFLLQIHGSLVPQELVGTSARQIYGQMKRKNRFVFLMEGMSLVKVDLVGRTWTVERTMNYHPDMLQLKNGMVFFCGGWRQDGTRTKVRSEVWLYDPKSKTMEQLLELGEEKTAVALVEMDGLIYAFGGARKGYYLKSANRYVLQSREKEILPQLPYEMRDLTATAYSENVYLCYTPHLAIERYDPITATYTFLMKASDRFFSQVLFSFQISHHLVLVCSRNSQIIDLEQLTLASARVTAPSAPKKCVSGVREYRKNLFFLSKSESGSLVLWQIRVNALTTIAISVLGQVKPAD